MNRNQRCLISILADHQEPLTTSEILNFTKNYPELCKGCSSGSQVISAGMDLVSEGIVERTVARGGFRWSLKNQDN